MFKISRRQTILRASIFGCLVVAVLSTAAYFINNHQQNTNATSNGDNVRIVQGNSISYQSYGTHYYTVVSGNKEYDGYCAEPSKDSPSGTKKATLLSGPNDSSALAKYKRIKLLIYLRENNNSATTEAREAVFGDIDNDSSWGSSPKNRIYAFTHATIGYIYTDKEDDSGLDSDDLKQVKAAITYLKTATTDSSNTAWQQAQTYSLFYANKASTGDDQDIVWIEATGRIIVNKVDSITGATPQGDGSFAGIEFTLSDGTTNIKKTLAAGATSITFSGLDLDKTYTISENGGTGYNISPAQGNITPTTAGAGTQVTFTNEIKKGNLNVKKIDKETGSCEVTTYGRSFAGTKIRLTNRSANPVVWNNTTYAKGADMGEYTFAQNQCTMAFNNLPYGTYEIKETKAAPGYVLDDTPKTIQVYPNNPGETVTYKFENQPIRGDIQIVKNDPANSLPMANTAFNISLMDDNNNVIESHIILADENGIVNTKADLLTGQRLHTFNTNGYDEIFYSSEDPITYAGYGTWFGKDTNGQALRVQNELGALPYGTYVISELPCLSNIFCYDVVNEKRTIEIDEHEKTITINWDNNCAPFSIQTEATDKADNDHYIEVGQETEIKDHVTFCAKKDFTFTITGTLMKKNKTTGEAEPFLVNGQPVEQTATIKPEEDCGTLDMYFPINTADLAGESIVVFEKLYYKDNVKSVHEDINDEGQTVDIVSLGTVAVDNSDEDKLIVPSEETVIKDTVSYCAPAGKPYTITGVLMDKTTGSPILVDNQPVTQSVTFTPEQNCGTVELIFPAIDTTAIAGHPIVAYETLYKVVPGEPGEPDTKEPILPHEDPNDPNQTVYVIDLYTTVKPNEDGTKVFPRDTDVTVTDTVHYCLQPGLEYTVKGIVMDRDTGNGLLVNSAPVEQTATFTPTETCGNFDMTYSFNTTDLGGARLVIFESLYYNDELLIEHKDIDNELESFEIDITPPETGFATRNHNGGQESSHQELIIIAIIATVPVIAYSLNRYRVRKSFLKR